MNEVLQSFALWSIALALLVATSEAMGALRGETPGYWR